MDQTLAFIFTMIITVCVLLLMITMFNVITY